MPTRPADMRRALRRLAEWPPSELPVISAYLDLRPQATGNNPQVRSGEVVLRDRLRDEERALADHTPAHDSLTADAERITRHVEEEALPEAQAVAIFACHGEGRFEAVEPAVGTDNEVHVAPLPRLLKLARLADDEPAVVALADTNTLRLFAGGTGFLREAGLVDDEPDDYTRTEVGGWSQARFQRHVDEHRAAFADLAAEAIAELARRAGARWIVLCGDDVAIPLLRERLPRPAADLVRGVLRVEVRASVEEVEAEALPFLDSVRREENRDAADGLVGAALGDGMGVGGIEQTRRALELGQVMELLIDDSAGLEGEAAEDLVHRAAATDARIRFVEDHPGLRDLGGVGALLRFRLDRSINEPADETEAAADRGVRATL